MGKLKYINDEASVKIKMARLREEANMRLSMADGTLSDSAHDMLDQLTIMSYSTEIEKNPKRSIQLALIERHLASAEAQMYHSAMLCEEENSFGDAEIIEAGIVGLRVLRAEIMRDFARVH